MADDLRLDTPLDGKDSISRVTTLGRDEESDTTDVQVRIETGRKHQIRRHLAGWGTRLSGIGCMEALGQPCLN